jgi:hypothetical protein
MYRVLRHLNCIYDFIPLNGIHIEKGLTCLNAKHITILAIKSDIVYIYEISQLNDTISKQRFLDILTRFVYNKSPVSNRIRTWKREYIYKFAHERY